MKQFLTDLELSHFRDKLNELTLTRTNNFWVRFKQFMLFKDQSELTGIVEDDKFIVWTYNSHLTGAFYPIFYGTFSTHSIGTFVLLRTKMNEIGIALTILIYGMMAYGLTTGVIMQEDNSFNFLIRRIGMALLLFSIFGSFPVFVYRYLKSKVLEFLTTELQLRLDTR